MAKVEKVIENNPAATLGGVENKLVNDFLDQFQLNKEKVAKDNKATVELISEFKHERDRLVEKYSSDKSYNSNHQEEINFFNTRINIVRANLR